MTDEQNQVKAQTESREQQQHGQTLNCDVCEQPGVVGDDLWAGVHVIDRSSALGEVFQLPQSGSLIDFWVHRSCIPTGQDDSQ